MWRSNVWRDRFAGFLLVFGFAIASLGDDCDDDKKKTENVQPASAAAPTPESLAGMDEGALKICAVPKVAMTDIPVTIVPLEVGEKPVKIELKKVGESYCEYWRGESLSRLWWNGLEFRSDANLTELGVYYLPKYTDRPETKDLSYAKAMKMPDSNFRLNVRVLAQIPHIEVQAR